MYFHGKLFVQKKQPLFKLQDFIEEIRKNLIQNCTLLLAILTNAAIASQEINKTDPKQQPKPVFEISLNQSSKQTFENYLEFNF